MVSIIVVVLQHRDELCRVLDSILNHRSPEIEIIVIDGGSTDGTVEILEALDSQIAYWVSEPDRGIYDAMNKGIAAARGTYIYHINAGDRLLCLPVNELRDADANGVDVVSFMVSVDNSKHFRPSCGWRLRLTNTLHHQGTFYRRAKFPGYDLRFKVFADFDVNQRTVSATGKVQALRHCCCRSQQQRSVKLQAAPWRDIPCNCFELWDPIRSAGLGTFSIRWYKDSSRKAGRWSRQIGNFLDKSLKS